MASSCLETRASRARQELLVKNEYSTVNVYSASHRDAIADSDARGRGTGQGTPQMWLPHCTSQINVFNYSNFITDFTQTLIGNSIDTNARDFAMTHSLYNPTHPYSENTYEMEANALDGIYIGY